MGQSPFPRLPGTCIAIWYKPADPGASAAPYMVTGKLLIVTVGAVAVD